MSESKCTAQAPKQLSCRRPACLQNREGRRPGVDKLGDCTSRRCESIASPSWPLLLPPQVIPRGTIGLAVSPGVVPCGPHGQGQLRVESLPFPLACKLANSQRKAGALQTSPANRQQLSRMQGMQSIAHCSATVLHGLGAAGLLGSPPRAPLSLPPPPFDLGLPPLLTCLQYQTLGRIGEGALVREGACTFVFPSPPPSTPPPPIPLHSSL